MLKFKRMSFTDRYKHLVETMKRFPVTFGYIVIATVHLCILASRFFDYTYSRFDFFMSLWSLSGIVFSYMVHLFAEDKTKPERLGITALTNILWTAVCAFFAWNYPLDGALTAACIACCVAIVLGLFVIPFHRQQDDRAAVSFALGFFGHAGLSVLVSGIVFLGLELLVQSFVYLFGFSIGEKQFLYLLVFCFVFLAPLLVVLQTPSAGEKYAVRDWMQHKFMNGVIHFLMIPLDFVYLATLYLYVIKIIVTWTLPDGWVSWLVTALMLLTIVIVSLLYPVNFQTEQKRFDRLVLRCLPLVVLPLLLLMTIGIVRRFNDYGVSVLRIYLLAFNLWCYAVCIGLYVIKARRLWWIAGSFAASLLVLSVLPYNVCTFTRDQLRRDVMGMAGRNGVTQFPMDKASFGELMKKLGDDQAELLRSKLEYLSYNYDSLGTEGIVDANTVPIYDFLDMTDTATVVPSIEIQCEVSDYAFTIPKGYTSYSIVKFDGNAGYVSCATKNDTLSVSMSYTLDGKKMKDVISMPLAKLNEMGEADNPRPVVFYGSNTCFCLTALSCYLQDEDEGMVEGILFIK